MDEWKSPYNSFNSLKLLFHSDKVRSILAGDFPPPISVTIDPTNVCNFKCPHCLYKEKLNPGIAEIDKLIELVDFLKEWGVQSICVAGGGEPSLYKDLNILLNHIAASGIECGMITNGTMIDKDYVFESLMSLKWLGFNIDAGNAEAYAKAHGTTPDKFFDVLDNMNNVRKLRDSLSQSNPRIGYKFLITMNSYKGIYDAIMHAVERGADDIHIRLAYNTDKIEQMRIKNVIENIFDEIELARNSFGNKINIYSIKHKFNDNCDAKLNFNKCRMTPLTLTFGADYNMWICCDRRGDESIKLGSWLDINNIKKLWGSDVHKNLIMNIKLSECPRCTFSAYNEMAEKCFLRDEMTYKFV